ncbi:MAG TPA: ATP-binding protein [bacterium]|nr:ATP-binding protein [bacterium]
MKKKSKTSPNKPAAPSKTANTAFAHFKLKLDPFSTLSLRPQNLDCFVGRELLIDRLCSSLFSLSNVGLAGEPGVGKSSLMRAVLSRVPASQFHSVSIGVPIDDAGYFLNELLKEMLVVIPSITGMELKTIGRRLEKESLSKNEVFSIIRKMVLKLKKPLLVFADDLEKIKGDRIRHLTRSERTLQVLEEVKPLLELPNIGFAISLQEEFYSKVQSIVRESGDPTVLGLFKNIILVEKFSTNELQEILAKRLEKAGYCDPTHHFFEPEALVLALALADGNPRRFLYLLSEGMYRGYRRKTDRVEFQDLFEAVNEHLKLDQVCRKLLYFLAKSGRAVASNSDLQSFMGLDMISIARRLEILCKNRLAEIVEVADGVKVYALPGRKSSSDPAARLTLVKMTSSASGEKVFNLLNTEEVDGKP